MTDLTKINNAASLLLEIGTEEIPSRFLPQAIEDLTALTAKLFGEYRIDYAGASVSATPRRLSLIVADMAPAQKDQTREVFGPSKNAAYDGDGNPTKAATGFAASLGIAVTDLVIKTKGKGEYVAGIVEDKGVETKQVLPELLKKLILSLQFPKSMRWGNGSMTFVRPIAWILAVAGGEKVDFEIDGLRSGNQTRGHRFLSPAAFQIRDISSYLTFLDTNFVMLDHNRRRETIIKAMEQLVADSGLQIVADKGLIETVNFLVEYPVPVLCSFDREYLKLPKELLITVMKDHQKYFALQEGSGSLSNSFIVVSNTRADNAETVRVGAQRVIKARFDDARFYYSEDTAKPLADRVEHLKDVTFHARLGSLFEKTGRIESIAAFLAARLCPALGEKAVRAARLSKTDLITGVVREFPELQGIMGRYYADHDGEPREVAAALEEQYLPKSFGDPVPATELGALLSLADKADNIASFFSLGLIPTGSEDPFALRRQAMGIVSILLEKGYAISLQELFSHALGTLRSPGAVDTVMKNIAQFMNQRTEFILSSAGHNSEIIRSVLQLSFSRPLKGITARIAALAALAGEKKAEFADFLLAIKRVNNIVPKDRELPAVQASLLRQDEEKRLAESLERLKSGVAPFLAADAFPAALQEMLLITPAINGFFDRVLVMDKDEEIRTNRLALLRDIWDTVAPVADFSKFQS